jgi:hypothetical protein
VAAFVVAALAGALLLGCTEGQPPPPPEEADFGACFSAFGRSVLATSANGRVLTYLTAAKPASVDDGRWQSGDRAVVMQDLTSAEGLARHIVLPWTVTDAESGVVPVYATMAPGARNTPRPYTFEEEMLGVQVAAAGDRFVIPVRRQGVSGLISKLYAGVLPPIGDTTVLSPGDGLQVVPVNNFEATEGVRSFVLSPDGNKLAAVVGNQGEVRIFDFSTNELSVYSEGPRNTVVVSHDLPDPAPFASTADRRPAVANPGVMNIAWSPNGDRLAVATDVPVNDAALAIMSIADGKLTPIRRFTESTVPQVAWAADGNSLYVMNTAVSNGPVFGNTAIRHLAAAEAGRELDQGGQIIQQPGYNTEPANFTNLGDDQTFLLTWQGGLWRLKVPNGELPKAELKRVSPPDATVPYFPPSVSLEADQAIFTAAEGSQVRTSNQYATIRQPVTRDDCPDGTAGEQPTAATPAEGSPAAATATSGP